MDLSHGDQFAEVRRDLHFPLRYTLAFESLSQKLSDELQGYRWSPREGGIWRIDLEGSEIAAYHDTWLPPDYVPEDGREWFNEFVLCASIELAGLRFRQYVRAASGTVQYQVAGGEVEVLALLMLTSQDPALETRGIAMQRGRAVIYLESSDFPGRMTAERLISAAQRSAFELGKDTMLF